MEINENIHKIPHLKFSTPTGLVHEQSTGDIPLVLYLIGGSRFDLSAFLILIVC